MKKSITVILAFLLLALATVNPVYASAQIAGPDIVYKQRDSLVTLSDITSLYSSYGNIITVKEDGYTGNGSTLGVYDILLGANDGLNETGTRSIQVKVVDTFGTQKIKLITNTKAIYTTYNQLLSHKEIIEALAITNLIRYSSNTSQAFLIKDDYTDNAANPGYYPFHFRIVDTSGYDETFQLFIYVIDDQLMVPPMIDMKPQGFNLGEWIWLIIPIGAFIYMANRKKPGQSKTFNTYRP